MLNYNLQRIFLFKKSRKNNGLSLTEFSYEETLNKDWLLKDKGNKLILEFIFLKSIYKITHYETFQCSSPVSSKSGYAENIPFPAGSELGTTLCCSESKKSLVSFSVYSKNISENGLKQFPDKYH